MSIFDIEIVLIAVVTAAACALPGVFLVLRRNAMISDAISHTVLLGIVLGFFLVQDLSSPWLIIGAAATGVLTVSLTSLLERTRLVKEDAATGLVFPALFSIAVILITRYAGNVHLDTDAVLVGEIAFAPFDRFILGGLDLGPRGLWVMGVILLVNLAFITLFYKELKISTFDEGFASALGIPVVLVSFGLVIVSAIAAVAAFDAVGSIIVIAMLICPPAAARLMTNRLEIQILWSIVFAIVSAVGGYVLGGYGPLWLGSDYSVSAAGMIATISGVILAVTAVAGPYRARTGEPVGS